METLELVWLAPKLALKHTASLVVFVSQERIVHLPSFKHLSIAISPNHCTICGLPLQPKILESSQFCPVASLDGYTFGWRSTLLLERTIEASMLLSLLFCNLGSLLNCLEARAAESFAVQAITTSATSFALATTALAKVLDPIPLATRAIPLGVPST
jgi:hypothetical protein